MTAAQVASGPTKEVLAHHEAVYPGMHVLWYENGDRRRLPCPAIVFNVSRDSVDLTVFYMDPEHGMMGADNKFAVRHVDDPRIPHKPSWMEAGGWDFNEEYRRSQVVAELALRVSALEERLEKLEKLRSKIRKPE